MRVHIEVAGKLLVATLSGSVQFDAALRCFRQVCDAAHEDKIDKILVNSLAVDGALAAHERYRLGADTATYITQRQMRFRLALVGVPPTTNGFGALVAQNRGVDTKVFPTSEEALSWLAELADEPARDLAAAPVPDTL